MMEPLSREALIRVIEGRGAAARVPAMYHFWIFPEVFGEREAALRALLDDYPCDIDRLDLAFPGIKYDNSPQDMYAWNTRPVPAAVQAHGFDNRVVIEDWDELDDFLAGFPSAEHPQMAPKQKRTGQYRLAVCWSFYFERIWGLRGMENALTDFFLYPDEVHRLFEALTGFYLRVIERAHAEGGADGIFTSDDIGAQAGPFFSPEIFRTFFKPYYKRLIDRAHQLGMHFWLHTCGNIEAFLDDFIEIGLDVIHPIQKYTMDDEKIAREYGDKICIWYGFDVQQTIPYGTPEDVRAEVRRILRTFSRPDGRFMLTMGNGSTPDWPLDSLRALFDETARSSVGLEQG